MSTIVKVKDFNSGKLNNYEFAYFSTEFLSLVQATTAEKLHVAPNVVDTFAADTALYAADPHFGRNRENSGYRRPNGRFDYRYFRIGTEQQKIPVGRTEDGCDGALQCVETLHGMLPIGTTTRGTGRSGHVDGFEKRESSGSCSDAEFG